MKKSICHGCGQACESPCAAFAELQRIYDDTRIKEKRQLIYRLRKQLGIVDAEPAPDLKAMAQKIIRKIPELSYIAELSIKVAHVRSYERKTKDGKALYADCRKVNKVYGAFLPYDFVITFYETNIGHLSNNQLKILMWHELKHIGLGDRGFILVPHDVEEFYPILDAHGARWDDYGAEVIDILE